MLAELARQDQIANDLANATTPGYKTDEVSQESFGEILLANRRSGQVVGSLGVGPVVVATETNLTQEALRETGEPLDLGLLGEGAFAVGTSAGVLYTRNGQLSVDAQGRLVTAAGLPLLGEDGGPIVVSSPDQVKVAPDGTVTDGAKVAGKLRIVSLTEAQKAGDGLLAGTTGDRPAGTVVRQGFLEASAVSAARTMVDMIASLRAFEAAQRVIRAIDETLQRGIQGASTTGV